MAFSPLAGGILTGKYKFDEPLPTDSRWDTWQKTRGLPSYWNAQRFNSMSRLAERSAELGISMAGLALAWCKYRPDVSTTLLGPKHTGHLDAVRDALKTLLTDAQLQEITDMFS